jgi:biopolymer transport protein ExbD
LNIGDDEESPIDDATVVERASAVLRRNAQTPVLVKADEAVPYGRVVSGAVLLQQAGATKIGFQTDPADDERERGGR